MVKVKLLTSRATATGPENRGDVVDVSADEAARMVESGQAELLRDGPTPERAVRRAPGSSRAKKA